MKLLAVVGSPRKRGNTDLLMDQVIEGAQAAGAEVQRVFLHGMDIAACDGCRGPLGDANWAEEAKLLKEHGIDKKTLEVMFSKYTGEKVK